MTRRGPRDPAAGAHRLPPGEVLNLRWRDVGDDALNLADSKTDPRAVPLGEAARALVKALPGRRDPDAYLFPRYVGKRMPKTLIDRWQAICADAQIGRLRLHDLRHTAASQAIMSGEGLSQVGQLLGHRRHRTTANYAHLADALLVEAAEKVGGIIATVMGLRIDAPNVSPAVGAGTAGSVDGRFHHRPAPRLTARKQT